MDRRLFLKLSSAFSSTMVISTSLSGCANTPDSLPAEPVTFTHGVASGDPDKDGIILWTRATPLNNSGSVTVGWQVATDAQFSNIIRSGQASTHASRDYTVKVDVRELTPNSRYFYRFLTQNSRSDSGETRTLPSGNVESLKLAVFSCSNYPAGFFTPYMAASNDTDIEFVVHLGDYIYEYGGDGYATDHAKEIGRTFAPDNNQEIVTLDDYRKRYAIYRSDTGLRKLHQNKPFIVVWDDHEVSNDTYKAGAENHQPDEGDFFERRAAAIQAYYEWLPIRPPMGESDIAIYRTFDFGDLVSLHMLDTRLIGRDKQLSYNDFKDDKTDKFDVAGFQAALNDPDRTIMGEKQTQWLFNQLEKSQAIWQVLGQQILMSKMQFPAEIFGGVPREKIANTIKALADIRRDQIAGQPVSENDAARLSQTMAYNLDAWDGYPAERAALYSKLHSLGKPAIVLAGDTHNAWSNRLRSDDGQTIGIELATSSVSSPGMEHYLSLIEKQAGELADDLPLLIDDLQYCNLHQRGYMTVEFTRSELKANWLYVDTILAEDFTIAEVHTERYSTEMLTSWINANS